MKKTYFWALMFAVCVVIISPEEALPAKPPPPVVTCTATTTPINFGYYDVFLATSLDSTGSVSVSCDSTTNVTVSVGASSVFPFLMDPRQMASGANVLNYNLYTDSTYTVIFGDDIVGSSVTKKVIVPKTTVFTVYGRIPALQDAAVGVYTDTLIVTVTW